MLGGGSAKLCHDFRVADVHLLRAPHTWRGACSSDAAVTAG